MGMGRMGVPASASAPTALGMGMMGAAPEASKPHATKLPLGSLRYDGKSFDQWQNEWKTELKPERRAEAINAFAAFGANGYGEEAAEAILEVMRGLDMDLADASFSKADFQKGSYTGTRLVKMSAIAGFLGVQPDYRIPPDDAVRVLSRELETGNRNGRLFAVFALSNMEHEAEAAVPALRTAFEGDEDPTVRCCAYVALGSMAPYLGREMDAALQVSPETLAELLEEAEPEALDRLLGTLVPPPGSWPGVLFREKPSSRARPAFGYSGAGDYYGGMEEEYYGAGMGGFGASTGPSRELRPGAEPIIQTLIEALDSENAATRSQAIQALGRVGPEVEGVVPALLRAFEKGRPYDREEILRTLERFASNETRSNMMPGMAGMPGGMPGGPGGYPSESEEQRPSAVEWKKVIPPLIAALDPRRPADLAMMGRIYARFGELAHETIPILEKAAEDEDEEVRRAAKQVLEVMSRSRNRGGVSGMGGMF